ncbi:uncharacterized protein LOC142333992 [Lycorma delicatula]|uniref:uncharacterized protein LOC142333992 n=1 Tax=Lycorma delicatula TaxID=130591 RepID=UPI003F512C9A
MWLDRAHGEVGYYTTQMLTGRGCFEEYLFRFGRRRSSSCMYCPAVDTAEHTLFHCPYWNERRRAADIQDLNTDAFLRFLLISSDNWKKFEDFARRVLRDKDEEARRRGYLEPSAFFSSVLVLENVYCWLSSIE